MPQHEAYSFPRLTRADYPLMRDWLAQPHVRAWWGDPDEEIDTGPTDMRLVVLDGHPFAYVQDYPVHHWPLPQYAGFPPGARGVDTFLGDPAYLGRGHAARYLRQRCGALLANCPRPRVSSERMPGRYRIDGPSASHSALAER